MHHKIIALFVSMCLTCVACTTQPEPNAGPTVAAQTKEQPKKEDSKKNLPPGTATLDGAKIQQVDRETGEVLGDVTFEVISVESNERRIMYPENELANASLEKVRLVDTQGVPVKVELEGKLTMIEYWSEAGLKSGKYWNRMRELENKHKDDPSFQFLSINWDDAKSKKAQIAAHKALLKDFTAPAEVLFDTTDGFRDSFGVSGPICYYIVDHRSQLLAQIRGDHPQVDNLDGHYNNAVKNLKAWQREMSTAKKAEEMRKAQEAAKAAENK